MSQGLRVCFTGPAYGPHGEEILRSDLTEAVTAMGMVVHPNFTTSTQLVVASRTDTTKAHKAASRGINVMTYPDFLSKFQVAVSPKNQGSRSDFVDTHSRRAPHPGLIGGNEL